MARLQNPRKRGLIDLFVVLILVVTVVGIGMLAFGNNNKIEELTRDEFFGNPSDNINDYTQGIIYQNYVKERDL